ncbi:Cohesin subunit psc3 [Smittium culicis]|uniref:Cohesin subunit psc3 n=1 Tax=Smittium culicis TaxID=133412 RepID=A0A1R1YC43_9FUNG|nr:Cohesin subunit psc3 [Smittium culicis]
MSDNNNKRTTRQSVLPFKQVDSKSMPPPQPKRKRATKTPATPTQTASKKFKGKLGATKIEAFESEGNQKASRSSLKSIKSYQEVEASDSSDSSGSEGDSHSDMSGSSSSDYSNDEEDEEEVLSYKAKKLPTKSTPIKNSKKSTASNKDSRIKSPKKKAKKPKQKATLDSSDLNCKLYSDLIELNCDVESISNNWIDQFCENNNDSIIEFANFTLRISGCVGSVEAEELLTTKNVEECLDRIKVENNQSEIKLEPLVYNKSKIGRSKLSQCVDFVKTIILTGSDVFIFGDRDHQLENLFDEGASQSSYKKPSLFLRVMSKWLETLSKSNYRPFRKIGTILYCNIKSSMSSLNKSIRDNVLSLNKQLEIAKKSATVKKNQNAANKNKISLLEEQISELTKQQQLIKSEYNYIFEKVFLLRYLDVSADIRVDCVNFLAEWTVKDHVSFLENRFLKYLGWLWNDSEEKVRLAAIDAIRSITDISSSVASQLRSFFDRFGPRLIQLSVADVDSNVMVAALKLIVRVADYGMLISDESRISSALSEISKPSGSNDITEAANDASSQKKTQKKKPKRSSQKSFSQQLIDDSENSDSESDPDSNTSSKQRKSSKSTNDKNSSENDFGIVDLYDPMIIKKNNTSQITNYPADLVLRYLSPLITHSQASVRSAAATLVIWWIKKSWIPVFLSSSNFSSKNSSNSMDVEDDDSTDKNSKFAFLKAISSFLCLINTSERQSSKPDTYSSDSSKLLLANIALSSNNISKHEHELSDVLAFLDLVNFKSGNKLNFLSATKVGFGNDSFKLIASAVSLYNKSADFQNIEILFDFLAQDHSVSVIEKRKKTKPSSKNEIMLSADEELSLLKASLVWLGSLASSLYNKASSLSGSSSRNSIYKQIYSAFEGFSRNCLIFFTRYKNQPEFLETLLAVSVIGFNPQYFFNSNKISDLKSIVDILEQILDVHKDNIIVSQLSLYLLAMVDDSKILGMTGVTLEGDSVNSISSNSNPDLENIDSNDNDLTEQSSDDKFNSVIKSEISLDLGPIIKKIVSRSFSSIISHRSQEDEESYTSLYYSLIRLRSIAGYKNISKILKFIPNTELSKASHNLSLDIDGKILSEKLLLLASGPFSLDQDENLKDVQILTTSSSLNLLLRLLCWRTLDLNQSISQFTEKNQDANIQYLDDSEYQKLREKVDMLVEDRNSFVESCFVHINSFEPEITTLFTSLITSASLYLLFSSDLVRNVKNNSDQVLGNQISLLKESMQMKISPHRLGSWTKAATTIFSNWSNVLVPYALTISKYSRSNKSVDLKLLKENQSFLISCLSHNGFVVELAKSFSSLIKAGVFTLSCLPMLASYTGRVSFELILNDYNRVLLKQKEVSEFNADENPVEDKLDQAENIDFEPSNTKDTTLESSKQALTDSSKKLAGFVLMSAFDNTVFSLLDDLKGSLDSDSLRSFMMKEYMRCMQLNFEMFVTNDLLLPQPTNRNYYKRQLSILPKIISNILKSVSNSAPAMDVIQGLKSPTKKNINSLANPVICSIWATLHNNFVKYGFDVIELCGVESVSSLIEKVALNGQSDLSEDDSKLDEKNKSLINSAFELNSLWYEMLSLTCSGLIRPKHAQIIRNTLQKEAAKNGLTLPEFSDPKDKPIRSKSKKGSKKKQIETVNTGEDFINRLVESGVSYEKAYYSNLVRESSVSYLDTLDEQISKLALVQERFDRNRLEGNMDMSISMTPRRIFTPADTPVTGRSLKLSETPI